LPLHQNNLRAKDGSGQNSLNCRKGSLHGVVMPPE
jgi:hypothetical protein